MSSLFGVVLHQQDSCRLASADNDITFATILYCSEFRKMSYCASQAYDCLPKHYQNIVYVIT